MRLQLTTSLSCLALTGLGRAAVTPREGVELIASPRNGTASPTDTLTKVCGATPTAVQYINNVNLQGPSDDTIYGGIPNVYGFHMLDWQFGEESYAVAGAAIAIGMNKSSGNSPAYSDAVSLEVGSYSKPAKLIRQSALWNDDMRLQGPGYYVFSFTWDMWCGPKYACKAYFAPGGLWDQTFASTTAAQPQRSLSGMKTSRFVKYDRGDPGYSAAIYFSAAVPSSVKAVPAGTKFGTLYLSNVTFLGPYKTAQQANACAVFDEGRILAAQSPSPLPSNTTASRKPPKQWVTNPTFQPVASGAKDTSNVLGYQFPGWTTNGKLRSLAHVNPALQSAVDSQNITQRHAAVFQSITYQGQKYVNVSQRMQDFRSNVGGYYVLSVIYDHACTGTYACVGSVYVPTSGWTVLFSTGQASRSGPAVYSTTFYVSGPMYPTWDVVGVRLATSRLVDPKAPALPKNTVLGEMDVYGLVIYGPYGSPALAEAANDYLHVLG